MDGVSSSDLKKMAKSPAHFRYWKDNPKEDTPSLLFGRAVHKYILEKDDFYKEFAVAPDINRRTKDGKAQWLLFQDQNEGKDIVSLDDFQQIKDMHYVLDSNSFARTLVFYGRFRNRNYYEMQTRLSYRSSRNTLFD